MRQHELHRSKQLKKIKKLRTWVGSSSLGYFETGTNTLRRRSSDGRHKDHVKYFYGDWWRDQNREKRENVQLYLFIYLFMWRKDQRFFLLNYAKKETVRTKMDLSEEGKRVFERETRIFVCDRLILICLYLTSLSFSYR